MKQQQDNRFDDWESFRQELLSNSEVKASYDALENEFRLAEEIIKARLARKMTQAELAEKAGMKQEAIARLEGGEANPTYKTLTAVARALDKKIALI